MSESNNELTFEQGMEELGGIVNRLEEGGIGVSRTVELCRRGKGLEQALRTELTTCEGELQKIEANEGLPEIRIVRRADEETAGGDVPAHRRLPAPAAHRQQRRRHSLLRRGAMSDGLNTFLDEIEEHAKTSLRTPVEVRPLDHFPSEEEIKVDKTWIKVKDVVAVFADLKNSTALNFKKHAQTSARLYEAVMSNCVRSVDRFDPGFVDVQGDALFALFHGTRGFERAMCAAITLKTFSEKKLVPAIENWEKAGDRFPETGLKIGMHSGVIAVKKVGVRGTNEPVWAGKPVNWAAKCAGAANRDQLIVTQAVYGKFEQNGYITHSCGCGFGGPGTATPTRIWVDEFVDKLPQDQMRCRRLTSRWCENCGDDFCQAVLDGKTDRDDVITTLAA